MRIECPIGNLYILFPVTLHKVILHLWAIVSQREKDLVSPRWLHRVT